MMVDHQVHWWENCVVWSERTLQWRWCVVLRCTSLFQQMMMPHLTPLHPSHPPLLLPLLIYLDEPCRLRCNFINLLPPTSCFVHINPGSKQMHPLGVSYYSESAWIPVRVFLDSQVKLVKFLVCMYEQREPLHKIVIKIHISCHCNVWFLKDGNLNQEWLM